MVAMAGNDWPTQPDCRLNLAAEQFSLITIHMSRLRIGAVSYLNTKPLVYGMDSCAAESALILDLPSRLADRLAAGDLDVALIPSIEAILDPNYTVVSDACIGCHGPVWSVKLLSRVAPEKIKTLALDEGSRTSRVLGRIILQKQFGVCPDLTALKMTDDWQQTPTDAVLIIGDRAMAEDPPQFPYVWDLGEAWHQWTGLPFVFAVWAARTRESLDRLGGMLSQARDHGVANIDQIVAANAGRYQLSSQQCRQYLQQNLHFHLGDAEKLGLELYFQYAAELNLIQPNLQLQFHDCQTTG
jgi:chorismate dehydratase